jgi:hypothetical protein
MAAGWELGIGLRLGSMTSSGNYSRNFVIGCLSDNSFSWMRQPAFLWTTCG